MAMNHPDNEAKYSFPLDLDGVIAMSGLETSTSYNGFGVVSRGSQAFCRVSKVGEDDLGVVIGGTQDEYATLASGNIDIQPTTWYMLSSDNAQGHGGRCFNINIQNFMSLSEMNDYFAHGNDIKVYFRTIINGVFKDLGWVTVEPRPSFPNTYHFYPTLDDLVENDKTYATGPTTNWIPQPVPDDEMGYSLLKSLTLDVGPVEVVLASADDEIVFRSKQFGFHNYHTQFTLGFSEDSSLTKVSSDGSHENMLENPPYNQIAPGALYLYLEFPETTRSAYAYRTGITVSINKQILDDADFIQVWLASDSPPETQIIHGYVLKEVRWGDNLLAANSDDISVFDTLTDAKKLELHDVSVANAAEKTKALMEVATLSAVTDLSEAEKKTRRTEFSTNTRAIFEKLDDVIEFPVADADTLMKKIFNVPTLTFTDLKMVRPPSGANRTVVVEGEPFSLYCPIVDGQSFTIQVTGGHTYTISQYATGLTDPGEESLYTVEVNGNIVVHAGINPNLALYNKAVTDNPLLSNVSEEVFTVEDSYSTSRNGGSSVLFFGSVTAGGEGGDPPLNGGDPYIMTLL